MRKGGLNPKDLFALLVIIVGSLGFLIWGLGLSSIGNRTLQWIGASIVALIGFIIAFLSRWLK